MSLIFIAVAINIGLNGLKCSQKSKCYYQVKAAHHTSGGSAGARTQVSYN